MNTRDPGFKQGTAGILNPVFIAIIVIVVIRLAIWKGYQQLGAGLFREVTLSQQAVHPY